MTETFEIITSVTITCDPSKFTQKFMDEFNTNFWSTPNIQSHLKYLAIACAQNNTITENSFVEGYGLLSNFGIKIKRTLDNVAKI